MAGKILSILYRNYNVSIYRYRKRRHDIQSDTAMVLVAEIFRDMGGAVTIDYHFIPVERFGACVC